MILGIRELITATEFAVCGLALFKGGPAERWGAAFILIAWSVVFVAQTLIGDRGLTLTMAAVPGLLSDFGLSCGFLWLALRYSSMWLAAAMMLQGVELALYGQFLAGGGEHRNDFAFAANVECGLLLLTILGGVATSWRRRVVERRAGLQAARMPDIAAAPAPPTGASYPRIMSTS